MTISTDLGPAPLTVGDLSAFMRAILAGDAHRTLEPGTAYPTGALADLAQPFLGCRRPDLVPVLRPRRPCAGRALPRLARSPDNLTACAGELSVAEQCGCFREVARPVLRLGHVGHGLAFSVGHGLSTAQTAHFRQREQKSAAGPWMEASQPRCEPGGSSGGGMETGTLIEPDGRASRYYRT